MHITYNQLNTWGPKKLHEKYFGNNSQIEINLIFGEGKRDVIMFSSEKTSFEI